MSNEINISAVTGLSPTIQLYLGTLAVGSPFSATERGSSGEYVASMPAVPYGRYIAVAMAGTEKLGSGEILWDGNYELQESLGIVRGLDPNNPATQTLSKLTAGDIEVDVSGNLEDTTTYTRKP